MISTPAPGPTPQEGTAGEECPSCSGGALQLYSISFSEDLLMCNTCLYPLDAKDASHFLRPAQHAFSLPHARPDGPDGSPACEDSYFDLSEPRKAPKRYLGMHGAGEKRTASSARLEQPTPKHGRSAALSSPSNPPEDTEQTHIIGREVTGMDEALGEESGSTGDRHVLGEEIEREEQEEAEQQALGWRLFEQDTRAGEGELRKAVAQLKAAAEVGSCSDDQIKETVTGATLRGMLPGRWMSDEAVNIFFSILVRDYPSLGYLSCSVPPLLMAQKVQLPEVCTAAAEQLRHGEIDALYVPLHVSDRRGLCVVSGDGTCYVLDALTSKDSRLAMVVDGLQTWLHEEFPLIEWQFYHPRSEAMRAFAADSGAFTCLCAIAFAHLTLDEDAAVASPAEFVQAFTGLIAKAPDAGSVRDAVLSRVVAALDLSLHSSSSVFGRTTAHEGLVDLELNQEIERELRESGSQVSLEPDTGMSLEEFDDIMTSPAPAF